MSTYVRAGNHFPILAYWSWSCSSLKPTSAMTWLFSEPHSPPLENGDHVFCSVGRLENHVAYPGPAPLVLALVIPPPPHPFMEGSCCPAEQSA